MWLYLQNCLQGYKMNEGFPVIKTICRSMLMPSQINADVSVHHIWSCAMSVWTECVLWNGKICAAWLYLDSYYAVLLLPGAKCIYTSRRTLLFVYPVPIPQCIAPPGTREPINSASNVVRCAAEPLEQGAAFCCCGQGRIRRVRVRQHHLYATHRHTICTQTNK